MRSDKFSKSFSSQCSTCGGPTFEYELETGPFICLGCGRAFEKEKLLRENGEVIDLGVKEITPDVAKYVRDDLRKSLRKTFSGSKHLKFK